MYLTYGEYQAMGGTLDEAAFNDFEMEAETVVDWYTFNRLQDDTEYPFKVKQCVYQLIKLAQTKQTALATGEAATGEGSDEIKATIASRSNDGVSISYNVMGASELYKALEGEVQSIVQRYLNGVMNQMGHKLLYRGIYEGE